MKSLRQKLAHNRPVRYVTLTVLRVTSRDVTIKNPWTGTPIRLNSYRHKGYWFYRRGREEATMNWFSELVRPGATVIEIGGHIGFIAQRFSQLVGPEGRLIVFEPGQNNLPYMRANIADLSNTKLETVAISDQAGTAVFYEDNVTGQNNSLLESYDAADFVQSTHPGRMVKERREVETITLDQYVARENVKPDFIKIDVEGHELAVLKGMPTTAKALPAMMVEVTQAATEVSALLTSYGFKMYDENRKELPQLPATYSGNVFALKPEVAG